MSHTSSQSSHNPAPDEGPAYTSEFYELIRQIQNLRGHLIRQHRTLANVVEAINERLTKLEHVDTFPMLSDLSTRLEALEEFAHIITGSEK